MDYWTLRAQFPDLTPTECFALASSVSGTHWPVGVGEDTLERLVARVLLVWQWVEVAVRVEHGKRKGEYDVVGRRFPMLAPP